MRTSLLFALVAFLVGCPGPSGPPDRSSPLLVHASTSIAANAIFLDTRDDDPLWAVSDSGGQTSFVDRSGSVAGPIPMHATDSLVGLRGLPGDEIWACVETGVAHFASGAWTFMDWASFGTTDAPISCDGLDARSGSDVWVSGSASLCRYDGAAWACRSDLPGQSLSLALTAGHAWLSHATTDARTDLVVVDTSSMTSTITTVDVGELVAIGDITPVPGAEQVWLTHDPHAFMNGDGRVHLFSTTGLVRQEEAQIAVPLSADHAFLVSYLDSDSTHCSGYIVGSCGTETLWSQVVVYEEMGTTLTERAHFTDPAGAGVPRQAIAVDGSIVFPGSPTFVLP